MAIISMIFFCLSWTNAFNGLSVLLNNSECILTTHWGNFISVLKTEQNSEGRGDIKEAFLHTTYEKIIIIYQKTNFKVCISSETAECIDRTKSIKDF